MNGGGVDDLFRRAKRGIAGHGRGRQPRKGCTFGQCGIDPSKAGPAQGQIGLRFGLLAHKLPHIGVTGQGIAEKALRQHIGRGAGAGGVFAL